LATSVSHARNAISAIASVSMTGAVGCSPRKSAMRVATCSGIDGLRPGSSAVVSVSIDSSIDMPRPSSNPATKTAASAAALRPG
jgi:hypothetical protein